MRISFDLDDTLICYRSGTPAEPKPRWYWQLVASREPLRLGSRDLLKHLQSRDCEIWIYTTSNRAPLSVKLWLLSYGILIHKVINRDVHARFVSCDSHGHVPSKNPASFGIDLHVDDSEGVRIEGNRYGFSVLVISPDDAGWAEKVLDSVEKLFGQ